jgi:elongation factor P
VTVAKGVPFIKTHLKNVTNEEIIEKNFKLNQTIQETTLSEKQLEYLYAEGKNHLFLDIATLDILTVPSHVIGEKIHFLKEGVEVKAMFHGDAVFSIALPQFLELMVVKAESVTPSAMQLTSSGTATQDHIVSGTKWAVLETGAKLEVPLFIEQGDIIRIDPEAQQFIQRV